MHHSALRPGTPSISHQTSVSRTPLPKSATVSELAARSSEVLGAAERPLANRIASTLATSEAQPQSTSTLPDWWDTEHLEDQFKKHASRIRSRALRQRPQRGQRSKNRGVSPRGRNVVDARSWGIKRGAFLSRSDQALLTGKYQVWHHVRDVHAQLVHDLGENPSQTQLAEAAGMSEEGIQQVMEDGPIAVDLLLESVKYLLRKMAGSFTGKGWEVEDLEAEARNLWLEAVLLYDPAKASLNSFAVMFVRQRLPLQMEAQEQMLARSPMNVRLDHRIAKVEIQGQEELGRALTLDEIAAKVNKPANRVATILKHRKQIISTDKKQWSSAGKSDALEGETVEETLLQEDNLGEGEDAQLLPSLRSELACSIEAALNEVVKDDMEKQMFLWYYQLVETGGPVSLKQLGKEWGVSHETVRKRVKSVMEKLQSRPLLRESLAQYHTPEILDY